MQMNTDPGNQKGKNMQTTHSSHPVKQGKQKEPFQPNNGMLLPLKSLKIPFSQIVHIIHNKIASQITATQCWPTPLLQQASNSTTCLGITQETLNKLKSKFHELYA